MGVFYNHEMVEQLECCPNVTNVPDTTERSTLGWELGWMKAEVLYNRVNIIW